MAKKSGNSFGDFSNTTTFNPGQVKPIATAFTRGSIPNSLYAMDRECSWTRWRRGYELATASVTDTSYEYPFVYQIPLPQGVTQSGTNAPSIPGIFKGFPTVNKEFGMHWAGIRVAGSLRFDNIRNTSVTNPFYWHDAEFNDYENLGQWFDPEFYVTNSVASIETVTEDADYWYVKLEYQAVSRRLTARSWRTGSLNRAVYQSLVTPLIRSPRLAMAMYKQSW
jgi:hypothetical protein